MNKKLAGLVVALLLLTTVPTQAEAKVVPTETPHNYALVRVIEKTGFPGPDKDPSINIEVYNVDILFAESFYDPADFALLWLPKGSDLESNDLVLLDCSDSSTWVRFNLGCSMVLDLH